MAGFGGKHRVHTKTRFSPVRIRDSERKPFLAAYQP
jgi:hypothetical protein